MALPHDGFFTTKAQRAQRFHRGFHCVAFVYFAPSWLLFTTKGGLYCKTRLSYFISIVLVYDSERMRSPLYADLCFLRYQ